MKKILVFSLSALLMVAFVSYPALAGPGCGANKTTKAENANAVTTSAKMGMSPEECAKLCGVTPEECAKMCADKKNCGFTQMSVKGMTCGGCESTVKTALASVDGVYKVIKVDYKEGVALVCCDPAKVDGKALTTAVTNKGYQAEIIPAVAKTSVTEGQTSKVSATGKACAPGCAKTCAAHAKSGDKCAAKKTGETKTAQKSDEG